MSLSSKRNRERERERERDTYTPAENDDSPLVFYEPLCFLCHSVGMT